MDARIYAPLATLPPAWPSQVASAVSSYPVHGLYFQLSDEDGGAML